MSGGRRRKHALMIMRIMRIVRIIMLIKCDPSVMRPAALPARLQNWTSIF